MWEALKSSFGRGRSGALILGLALGLFGCISEPPAPRDVLRELPGMPLTEAQINAIPLNQPFVWLAPEGGVVVLVEERERWTGWTDELGFWERRTASKEASDRLAALTSPKSFALPEEQWADPENEVLYNAIQSYFDALQNGDRCRQLNADDPAYQSGQQLHSEKYGPCDWPASTTVLVDRSVPYEALRGTIYRLGQARMSSFDIRPYGPQLNRKGPAAAGAVEAPGLAQMAPFYSRPAPLEPRQTDSGTLIDDGDATIQIRLKNEPEEVFDEPAGTPEMGMMLSVASQESQESTPAPEPPDTVGDAYPVTDDPFLFATFTEAAAVAAHPVLPSVEMLVHRSKISDDALMAALERKFDPLTKGFIHDLSLAVQGKQEARAWVAAAASLGEIDAGALPPKVVEQRDEFVTTFNADPGRSTVLGIYSESADLERGFLRDRMLMSDLAEEKEVRAQLVEVLDGDPKLAGAHQRLLAMRAALHNGPVQPDLTHPDGRGGRNVYLFPPAHSALSRLPAEDRSLDILIKRVQAGEHSLSTRKDSGWFDYQIWALEPLLTLPELGKLELSPDYRVRLEKAFRSAYSMRLETHIKLTLPSIGGMGPAVELIWVSPSLRVEPAPTQLARTAESYRFLKQRVLDEALASIWQSAGEDDVARLSRDIEQMERRFDAWAALSRADLGLEQQGTVDPAAVLEAEAWLTAWREDPAMSQDIRMMVPQTRNPDGSYRVTVMMGVTTIDIVASYGTAPEVKGYEVVPAQRAYSVLMPVTEEVDLRTLLSREEFRALADKHTTKKGLLQALKSL